jgi:signal transduction histidine kinase
VHNWDTILSTSLPGYVFGLIAVLHADGTDYTFRITEGKARYIGQGDPHDVCPDLHDTSGTPRHFSFDNFEGSTLYSVSVYPTDEFSAQFHTMGPIYAGVGAGCIIIITSLIFLLYDYFMNRNAIEKELINNTKRLFVRFISHEIRTPMNTVYLGLKLLADEMRSSLLSAAEIPMTNGEAELNEETLNNWIDLITDIEESSDTAIAVLNDLLNYDKIGMGTLQIEHKVVYMWDVISSNVNPFFVQAREANVELLLQMMPFTNGTSAAEAEAARHLLTLGDSVKLGQVVRNLVSNAVKFTPSGGTITVTAQWCQNGLPDVHFDESDLMRAGSLILEGG